MAYATVDYLAMKRNELLIYTTAWINLKIITMSERSQIKKDTYYNDSMYVNARIMKEYWKSLVLTDMFSRFTGVYICENLPNCETGKAGICGTCHLPDSGSRERALKKPEYTPRLF